MTRLSFRPLIEPRRIDNDLSIGREFNFGSVHGTRRRSFEVDALAVVTAAVARTLEFVFTGLPIRRAAEMRAAGVDYKNPVGSAIDPDAIFLLELGVHSQSEF